MQKSTTLTFTDAEMVVLVQALERFAPDADSVHTEPVRLLLERIRGPVSADAAIDQLGPEYRRGLPLDERSKDIT